MSKVRDEMALESYNNKDKRCLLNGEIKQFRKGWDAALKHDPVVLALIEALEFYVKLETQVDAMNRGGVTKRPPLDFSRKALESYKKEVGDV